jgi:hypothetical protein
MLGTPDTEISRAVLLIKKNQIARIFEAIT